MAIQSSNIILKQFRAEGCLSYLLFDPFTKEAVVIDPHLELLEDYKDYINQKGLKPVVALDTHIHADHFSATHFFRKEYKSDICMSAKTFSQRVTRKLRHGDKILAGSIELQILETPGHTPDSISVFGHGLVFTGDTLLIGSSGRTDFPGADAGAQWESLHKVIGELPANTAVLPGHDYNGFIFSTLETERKKNLHWMLDSKEKFVALKKAESISTSAEEIRKRVDFNMASSPASVSAGAGCATACGVPLKESSSFESLDVRSYRSKKEQDREQGLFIDVREQEEFQEGHIPDTRNIPLSELSLHIDEIPKSKNIYLSCLSGGRSGMAAKTLNYLGYPHITNITGGFKGWVASGFPIQK